MYLRLPRTSRPRRRRKIRWQAISPIKTIRRPIGIAEERKKIAGVGRGSDVAIVTAILARADLDVRGHLDKSEDRVEKAVVLAVPVDPGAGEAPGNSVVLTDRQANLVDAVVDPEAPDNSVVPVDHGATEAPENSVVLTDKANLADVVVVLAVPVAPDVTEVPDNSVVLTDKGNLADAVVVLAVPVAPDVTEAPDNSVVLTDKANLVADRITTARGLTWT